MPEPRLSCMTCLSVTNIERHNALSCFAVVQEALVDTKLLSWAKDPAQAY
jgi:hypothetical protein